MWHLFEFKSNEPFLSRQNNLLFASEVVPGDLAVPSNQPRYDRASSFFLFPWTRLQVPIFADEVLSMCRGFLGGVFLRLRLSLPKLLSPGKAFLLELVMLYLSASLP